MLKKAKPIWITGKEREMNVYAVFKTEVTPSKNMELHIAGTAFYRIYANEKFVAAGPARTAKGYVREDVLRLDEYVTAEDGNCEIVIEACGYYCRSLSTCFQPSYIMAEVQSGEDILAYSSKDFRGFLPGYRLQKTDRYTVQRHFIEIWDYRRCEMLCDDAYEAEVAVVPETPHILERRAPYPMYEDVTLTKTSVNGTYIFDETLPCKDSRWIWKVIPEHWGRYQFEEMEHRPWKWIWQQKQTVKERDKALPLTLKKGEYAVLDFGRIEAGFLKADLECLEESDVVIGFCEYYEGDEFKYQKMGGHHVLEYFLRTGDRREVLSFEAYTFRYVIVLAKEGSVKLHSFGAKSYMFDIRNISSLECENEMQEQICKAAIRTFAHNAVDLYMDCPSRERAGWLCDSYFTSRTEYAMTGKTAVEDAFLENYRLFKNDGSYPDGMLPDCYPSDARNHVEDYYIPQWTMWYILEVEEYIKKRGHEDMVEKFRESIYGLLKFFQRYENEDGLLERLPAWNFVEWSKANEWTMDVNYPTNFLYARALEAVYHLYGDKECKKRCEEIRETAVRQSFNGRYFLDHAVRDEKGALQLQTDSSEACQYYAVLFAGIDISDKKYAELKHLILNVFKPEREGIMPEIFEVNAFIGAYLRMDVLLKMKEYRLVLSNVEEFFGKMAKYTGTLWEYREFKGSHDHGFASYAYAVIKKALEGLKEEKL